MVKRTSSVKAHKTSSSFRRLLSCFGKGDEVLAAETAAEAAEAARLQVTSEHCLNNKHLSRVKSQTAAPHTSSSAPSVSGGGKQQGSSDSSDSSQDYHTPLSKSSKCTESESQVAVKEARSSIHRLPAILYTEKPQCYYSTSTADPSRLCVTPFLEPSSIDVFLDFDSVRDRSYTAAARVDDDLPQARDPYYDGACVDENHHMWSGALNKHFSEMEVCCHI